MIRRIAVSIAAALVVAVSAAMPAAAQAKP